MRMGLSHLPVIESQFPHPPQTHPQTPRHSYRGEQKLPLIIQNIHRYAWYFAFIFGGILTWDAVIGFDFNGHFGIGVGSVILAINAILILGYTLGCHSCRHITAGQIGRASCRERVCELV